MPLQTFQDVLTITIEAGGAFDAYDLIGFDGKKIASDDAAVMGIAKSPATAAGQMVPIMVRGIARVKAAAAIVTPGSRLMTATAGGVKPATAPSAVIAADTDLGAAHPFAIALQSAGNGDYLDILI